MKSGMRRNGEAANRGLLSTMPPTTHNTRYADSDGLEACGVHIGFPTCCYPRIDSAGRGISARRARPTQANTLDGTAATLTAERPPLASRVAHLRTCRDRQCPDTPLEAAYGKSRTKQEYGKAKTIMSRGRAEAGELQTYLERVLTMSLSRAHSWSKKAPYRPLRAIPCGHPFDASIGWS